MLIIAIPFGLFLTGVMWHLLGVCNSVLLVDMLRFSADKTAFESAIWHARGMNVLAMLNLLMTSLSAVWVAWTYLYAHYVSISALCYSSKTLPTPVPGCDGHDPADPDKAAAKMAANQPQVEKWLGDTAIKIHELQKITSSVTPTIAVNRASALGSSDPLMSWFEASIPLSGSLVPDKNIDSLTGFAGISGKYPRLGMSADLPALPVEATSLPNFCYNVAPLVPDIMEQMSVRMGLRWTFVVAELGGSDWRKDHIMMAEKSSCTSFAAGIDGVGIWYLAKYKSDNAHEYAFQVMGAAFGKADRLTVDDNGVQIAGKGSGSLAIDLRPWTLSQAEFYFDCGGDRWKDCAYRALHAPNWTARLRRVRRPDDARVLNYVSYVAIPASVSAKMPAGLMGALLADPNKAWNRAGEIIH